MSSRAGRACRSRRATGHCCRTRSTSVPTSPARWPDRPWRADQLRLPRRIVELTQQKRAPARIVPATEPAGREAIFSASDQFRRRANRQCCPLHGRGPPAYAPVASSPCQGNEANRALTAAQASVLPAGPFAVHGTAALAKPPMRPITPQPDPQPSPQNLGVTIVCARPGPARCPGADRLAMLRPSRTG